MEDVLDVYHLPYDASFPVLCLDEKPYQLLADNREQISSRPGRPLIEDYEYERRGTCSIFITTEPLTGFRHVVARERRTSIDWAHEIAYILDEIYPNVAKVRLIMDNLNTHSTASLYAAFPAEKARRLAKRLDIHYTPKHGSWLNIAEIELNVLTRQCLNRRLQSLDILNTQLRHWETRRNCQSKHVNWQFTASDARIRLKHLYPVIEETEPSITWFKP